MKIATLIIAGLTAAASLAPVAAQAQRTVVHERTVVRHDRVHHAARRVCTTQWRHHHRVRTCRTVRR
ncbi:MULTISPECIES: hypothetical protein [unclassified Sphingomonas]|uniref:hypothetical protein n=1 Tax=unclassified Sphingomonas TaxID=196159 RepID=UPI001F5A8E01|nr:MULTISPECIES: hypothetical protein [unclassified Sphingomonas]